VLFEEFFDFQPPCSSGRGMDRIPAAFAKSSVRGALDERVTPSSAAMTGHIAYTDKRSASAMR